MKRLLIAWLVASVFVGLTVGKATASPTNYAFGAPKCYRNCAGTIPSLCVIMVNGHIVYVPCERKR